MIQKYCTNKIHQNNRKFKDNVLLYYKISIGKNVYVHLY
jgi:hypothetical protein